MGLIRKRSALSMVLSECKLTLQVSESKRSRKEGRGRRKAGPRENGKRGRGVERPSGSKMRAYI